ncbi:MAG: DUF1835 domain-containing protein [Sporolactobacillus sp.]|nr:DUF1835 domain-containing protein [Sporolactobacillus sp.]
MFCSKGAYPSQSEAGGAVARTAWLRQYRDGDDHAEAEPPFGECIEALRAIPGADSLMIWTADNAHDRTALALAARPLFDPLRQTE